MRERRRSNRVDLQGFVHHDLGGRQFTLPAADISVSGLGVLIDAALFGNKPAGEVGVCRIVSPELGGAIEAYVSLMRIRHFGDRQLLGLRFESIGDAELERIRGFNSRLRMRPAG